MAKFQAAIPDLDLELKTLTGEEIFLKPKKVVSSQVAIEITKFWMKIEKEQKEKVEKKKEEEGLGVMEIITKELAYIYPKESEWFLKNFDVTTLNNILLHVAEAIGGLKKREKN